MLKKTKNKNSSNSVNYKNFIKSLNPINEININLDFTNSIGDSLKGTGISAEKIRSHILSKLYYNQRTTNK
ncbi:hypothetical protein [Buchnera aphidicola]|uniref:hypothetical protein n=1 Tax=Buchnera aphidicola TaxID=9 RepID=UPI003463CFC3